MRGLNIAREMRRLEPNAEIVFFTRGEPPSGFKEPWLRYELASEDRPGANWTATLRSFVPQVVVYDTMLPKAGELPSTGARTVYIMRKCQSERQKQIFADPMLRRMDSVIVPHTPDEFTHALPDFIRLTTCFVGPIVRLPNDTIRQRLRDEYALSGRNFVVVSTPGGGGFQEEAEAFFDLVFRVHNLLAREPSDLRHIVVRGPKFAGELTRLQRMTIVNCEPELASLLAEADVVISAGGYNTVNEIRAAKTPAIFLPSPRTHDDQNERVAALARRGLAVVVRESTVEMTAEKIADVCSCDGLLQAIRNRYAEDDMQIGNLATARRILKLTER